MSQLQLGRSPGDGSTSVAARQAACIRSADSASSPREPMLRSRIFRRVNISPLSGAQVCELMGAFHPIYNGVDAEVLLLVDDHFGHGNLRNWASFTHTAAALCAEHGRPRLDTEIARNAFALHSGGIGV